MEKKYNILLDNDSTYYGTYAELEGDGLVDPTQAFKDANAKALNSWSKFIDVQFEEITETNENVGDWRIGITDKDHFMPDLLMIQTLQRMKPNHGFNMLLIRKV